MKGLKFGLAVVSRVMLLVMAVTFATIVPFAGHASASHVRVGIGSSLTAWRAAYGSDSGCSKNLCFGNPIPNSPSGKYQFTEVEFSGRSSPRADSYQEDFANHTSVSFALFNLKLTLPPDSRYTKPRVGRDSYGDSCLVINATSASLNKTTRINHFMVELFKDDSNGLTTYKASDVTAAWVQPFVLPTSGGC